MQSILNLIGGEWKPSQDGLTFVQRSLGESVEEALVSDSKLLDVVQAIASINRSNLSWLKEPEEARRERWLRSFQIFVEWLDRHRSMVLEAQRADTGQSQRSAELSFLSTMICLKQVEPLLHRASLPVGTVGVILGATDPMFHICRRVWVALAAGNAVVVKPSSQTPRIARVLAEGFQHSLTAGGVPPALVAILFGRGQAPTGDAVGESMVRHPGINTIVFVGSTEVALRISPTVAEFGKRFHFSGSGRNPIVIFDGFDATELARKLTPLLLDFQNLGPFRPSRLFVQETSYKPLLDALAKCFDDDREVRLMRPRLREQFYLQLHMALSETGKLVTGSADRQIPPQPTLIRDLTNCSTLQQEELAGPWVTAASFKYQHEALKYANTSPLALAGYVLHPDQSRARRVAEKIEAARWVSWSHVSQIDHKNIWPALALMEAPGLKQSGHSGDGIEQVWRTLSRSGVHLQNPSSETI